MLVVVVFAIVVGDGVLSVMVCWGCWVLVLLLWLLCWLVVVWVFCWCVGVLGC